MIEENLLLSNSYWVRVQYDKCSTSFLFYANLFDHLLGETRSKYENEMWGTSKIFIILHEEIVR